MTPLPPFQPHSRRRFLVGAGSLAAMAMIGCGSSGGSSTGAVTTKAARAEIDGDLTIFTWESYIPESVIRGFEKEFGVKVKQTYYSTVEESLKKLSAGLPYDLTFIASNYITRAVDGGLLRPVDHDGMPNRDQLLPAFLDVGYEPNDPAKDQRNARYVGMPYALGGIGMAWLVPRIGETELTGSWEDLWTQAAGVADGHAWAFDESQFTLAMALAKLGKDINTTSASDLQEATAALRELKEHLAGFSPTTVTNQLLNGTGWIQMAYTGDTFQALNQAKDPSTIRWQACRESAIYNSDNCAIPTAARHPGTATVFMDYLLRPENIKQAVDLTGYIIPTRAGVDTYDALVADYPFLKADTGPMQDFSQWIAGRDQATLRLWNQAWLQVKAG